MSRTELITGIERRRRWSDEQKRAIVSAAFAPDVAVTDVARQADIHPNQIYRWRKELSESSGFAQIVVAKEDRELPVGRSAIEIAIGHDIHARIAAGAPPSLAAAVLKALTGR
jgi:transposase